jgi:hypothetical protein
MKNDIQELPDLSLLKENFTIEDAWKALNLPGEPGRICRSPLREDRNPSFTIYDSGHRWKDWGADDGGDVIDFISKARNLSIKDSIAEFRRMAGGDAPTSTTTSFTTAPKVKKTNPEEDAKRQQTIAERAAVMASLRLPTEAEMQIIADLRKVSLKAVFYLAEDGHIKVGKRQNHLVFAIQSGDFAQIRRMDGRDFWEGGPKELNMAEPTPAFIGLRNNSPTGTRTIIAEGLIELLALVELEIRAEDYRREHFPDSEYQPVAFAVASSAHSKVNDVVLGSLRCNAIRIIGDNDTQGRKAVMRWTENLQGADIPVDNRIMPIGKDLGDALPLMPDSACYNLLQF